MAQLVINVPETSDLMRYLPEVVDQFVHGDALEGSDGQMNWKVIKD